MLNHNATARLLTTLTHIFIDEIQRPVPTKPSFEDEVLMYETLRTLITDSIYVGIKDDSVYRKINELLVDSDGPTLLGKFINRVFLRLANNGVTLYMSESVTNVNHCIKLIQDVAIQSTHLPFNNTKDEELQIFKTTNGNDYLVENPLCCIVILLPLLEKGTVISRLNFIIDGVLNVSEYEFPRQPIPEAGSYIGNNNV